MIERHCVKYVLQKKGLNDDYLENRVKLFRSVSHVKIFIIAIRQNILEGMDKSNCSRKV